MSKSALIQKPKQSEVSKLLRYKQSVLLAGMMLLDDSYDLSPGTIRFFAKAYPVFLDEIHSNATTMAELAGLSTPAATAHLKHLVEAGYLERKDYRNWKLNTKKIEEMNRGRGEFNDGRPD